jgi:hypothetical protein
MSTEVKVDVVDPDRAPQPNSCRHEPLPQSGHAAQSLPQRLPHHAARGCRLQAENRSDLLRPGGSFCSQFGQIIQAGPQNHHAAHPAVLGLAGYGLFSLAVPLDMVGSWLEPYHGNGRSM